MLPYLSLYSNVTLATPSQLGKSVQSLELYERQMEKMARHARNIFLRLGGVKEIPGSVRVFATIQHTVLRCKTAFADEPTLQMFIDGSHHNATSSTVRSVRGIACKTGVMSGKTVCDGSQVHGKIIEDRRLSTVNFALSPQLF